MDVTNALGSDPSIDSDGDGLSGFYESSIGTDPNNPDSDFDGASDSVEVRWNNGFQTGTAVDYNPGVNDTDPNTPDSDGDGFLDGFEIENFNLGTDPLNASLPGAGFQLPVSELAGLLSVIAVVGGGIFASRNRSI